MANRGRRGGGGCRAHQGKQDDIETQEQVGGVRWGAPWAEQGASAKAAGKEAAVLWEAREAARASEEATVNSLGTTQKDVDFIQKAMWRPGRI